MSRSKIARLLSKCRNAAGDAGLSKMSLDRGRGNRALANSPRATLDLRALRCRSRCARETRPSLASGAGGSTRTTAAATIGTGPDPGARRLNRRREAVALPGPLCPRLAW